MGLTGLALALTLLALALGLLGLVLTTAGCRPDQSRSRVLILGLDGFDPTVVDLLMSEGKLPNFAKLRQEGAYAPLLSARPLLSPVVWTTIATGKPPESHRIGHFVAINPKTGQELPVTSRMRQVKALWNLFSEKGRSVAVVGWWASWPAETVRGSIVSDHLCFHFLMEEGATMRKESPGLTYPPELLDQIRTLIRRPSDLQQDALAPFVTVPDADLARPFDFEDDLSHFRWALATAETYKAIGEKLWDESKPDLGMIYIEGTDSTSHLFGHLFRATNLSGELAEQERRYGRAVEQIYLYADKVVGEMIARMDARTTLMVLSDHGFELGALPDDPSKTRDMRRVTEKYHTMHGILYLYGHGIRPGTRLQSPTILDITPTVLALGGLSPARDMPGRVLNEAFDRPAPESIPTYETSAPSGATADGGGETDAEIDPQILEQLRSLGYLQTTSPTSDRNLAAVLFESGRYEESENLYRRLVADKPDDGSLRTSYAGALGALGRFDEAMRELDVATKLEPLNPEAYHNRAVIYERRGDLGKAIEEYRKALRYSPQYEPSKQALERLNAPSEPSGHPDGSAEQLAYRIASQASEAAKRGDYREAMAKLDEAQKIAPKYALIYQYRANVAYLMGDQAGAIAALRKGLEIEPDNALFRENLKNLLQPAPGQAAEH